MALIPFAGLRSRRLIYLDSKGVPHAYRLGFLPTGRPWLRPLDRVARGGRVILVLDAGTPYRRRFRSASRHLTPDVLRAAATDLFPFTSDQGRYALGRYQGQSALFALPEGPLDEILAQWPKPRALLVGGPDKVELLAALEQWFRHGRVMDLLAAPPPLHPARARMALLLAVLLLAGGVSWYVRDGLLQQQQQVLAARYSHSRQVAAPLETRYHVLLGMSASLRAFERLQGLPGPAALERLATLFPALPSGASIDRLQLRGGRLLVKGWGPPPGEWLPEESGFTEKEYQPLPEGGRFVLEAELSRGAM